MTQLARRRLPPIASNAARVMPLLELAAQLIRAEDFRALTKSLRWPLTPFPEDCGEPGDWSLPVRTNGARFGRDAPSGQVKWTVSTHLEFPRDFRGPLEHRPGWLKRSRKAAGRAK